MPNVKDSADDDSIDSRYEHITSIVSSSSAQHLVSCSVGVIDDVVVVVVVVFS